MGLFDQVYVSSDVAAAFELRCAGCDRVPSADAEWQTKSLDPSMVSYLLRHDDNQAIRLYLLDKPADKRFWRPWTAEEIAASERDASRGGLFALWQKRRGEGTWLPDAYLPRNRRQRFLGELPHQWVEIYTRCACSRSLTYSIKFCDGVATEVRSAPPRHAPGFFDDASELGE
jgi:hypothetical protein